VSRSFAEIVSLYHERQIKRAPEFASALDVRDHYNGDVVVPLPELDKSEKVAVARLLNLGLDQTSMRIASTQPEPYFAPLRPGFDNQEQAAEDRHKCVLGWWDMNNMEIKDARRARHFIGYGISPSLIVPDFKRKIPKWEIRDPLMTYPAPSSDRDDMTPDNCIFAFHQSATWLRINYPDAYARIARMRGPNENPDNLFEILEYIDDEDWVLGVIGSKRDPWDQTINGTECEELVRTPNKAGICTAVIPGRVTLDRKQGQYDGMLGMFQQQAMLQALSVIATKKGIFKDEWVVARANEVPKIIRMANGLQGEIGIISGGDIKEVPLDPSYMSPQMIDRLERYQRVEGGVPAAFGGETTTNVRTGRMGDNILGATIDFTVQEAQKVLAKARQEENKRAIAIDKAFWKKPKSFYVPWDGSSVRLDYTPEKLWVSDEHRVTYAHAGVDENGRTVEIGQLLGMNLIPKSEARRLHPLIQNPREAGEMVVKEQIDQALLAGIQQAASQPGANIADFARISQLVTQNGTDLAQAILDVQKEAQARQAPQDAQGADTTVDPNSPDAQPGMAAPGQGAEAAAQSSIPPQSPSMQNLSFLLRGLHTQGQSAGPTPPPSGPASAGSVPVGPAVAAGGR